MLFEGLKVKLTGLQWILHSKNTLSRMWALELKELLSRMGFKPDIVVTRGAANFYVGFFISKFFKTPLVLHIASIRGLKFPAFVIYKKQYSELIRAPLSITHHILQCNVANATILSEWFTYSVLRKFTCKPLFVIEPTFALRMSSDKVKSDNIQIPSKPYALSLISGYRITSNEALETEQFKILLNIAAQVHDIPFVVVGVSPEEAITVQKRIPENVIFTGRINDDNLLRYIYENACVVVNPILLRSQSNRFLEALFYGKTIITTSLCTSFYKGLRNLNHVIIEDDFARYPYWIRKLFKNSRMRQKIEKGASQYFSLIFSPIRHGKLFHRVLEWVLESS